MSKDSHKYVIYQGANELFRWRGVDDEGNTLRDSAGNPVSSNIEDMTHFKTREECITDLRSFDPFAEAEFKETIQEVAEREAREAREATE